MLRVRQALVLHGRRGLAAAAAGSNGASPTSGTPSEDASKLYQKTLLLPKTAFPMRADAAVREPLLRDRTTVDLYRRQAVSRASQDPFVLHDGPPYANGRPHLGHALNKILKDFVLRFELSRGRRVHNMPGWDCHGLPIELKALGAPSSGGAKDKGKSSAPAPKLSPLEVRAKARGFALSALDEQRDEMRSWGLLADLDGETYRTLDPSYEAAQLEVFAELVRRGIVYRAYRPVYWSPATRTALAEAELEYQDDHESRAVHVAYELADTPDTDLLVWTTTPWTLPANRAIAVHPELDYVTMVHPTSGRKLIVAAARADAVMETLGVTESSLIGESVSGASLVGRAYRDPFASADDRRVVIGGDHVTSDAGTGLVHTAPAHGLDDFYALRRAGTTVSASDCFVDESGRYTSAAPRGLSGLRVLPDGADAVIKMLSAEGRVLHDAPLRHRYPYDWRAKQPVIVRATEQWFCRLQGVAPAAVAALRDVDVVPRASRHRLESMLAGRDDWCISRQRVWGVPIPVFFHKDGAEPPLMTPESIAHAAAVFGAHPRGSDAWWELPLSELLPPSHSHRADEFVRGQDTMDVWFDSGTSWASLLARLSGEASEASVRSGRRADVYLEGSDQHRGWFQSSLLTSVAVRDVSPYRKLITHGFVLDERGRKMSKSLGNIVEPSAVVRGGSIGGKKAPAYGADTLRMWVASTEYTSDVGIGPSVLEKVSESLRKLRNTMRFMLGNLHDMHVERALEPSELLATDRYMLHLLHEFRDAAERAYEAHHYSGVYSQLMHMCSATLSGFYFESVKGRLYTGAADGRSRLAAQSTLLTTLHTLNRVAAPIAVHLGEEVFDAYRHTMPSHVAAMPSVFDAGWPSADELGPRADAALVESFQYVLAARALANKELDAQRKDGRLKTAQEATITFAGPRDGATMRALRQHKDELPAVFGAAIVELEEDEEDAFKVEKSRLQKCPRCWNHTAHAHNTLCGECEKVVKAA